MRWREEEATQHKHAPLRSEMLLQAAPANGYRGGTAALSAPDLNGMLLSACYAADTALLSLAGAAGTAVVGSGTVSGAADSACAGYSGRGAVQSLERDFMAGLYPITHNTDCCSHYMKDQQPISNNG